MIVIQEKDLCPSPWHGTEDPVDVLPEFVRLGVERGFREPHQCFARRNEQFLEGHTPGQLAPPHSGGIDHPPEECRFELTGLPAHSPAPELVQTGHHGILHRVLGLMVREESNGKGEKSLALRPIGSTETPERCRGPPA